MYGYFVFTLLLPSFVAPQASHCYRCFGSTWCNNFTDPSFTQNVDIIECQTPSTHTFEGKTNPYTQSLLNSLKTVADSINGPENYEGSLMGCVTATIHEAHEDHTVRVCMNQASIICPTIRNVVLSNVNDISSDVTLSCAGCTSNSCNTHIFVEDELTTTPPSSPSTDPPSPSSESSTATSESSSSSDPSSPSSESSTVSSELPSSSNPPSLPSSDSSSGSSSSSTTSEVSPETTTELQPTTDNELDDGTTRAPGSGYISIVSNLILLITIMTNLLVQA